MASSHEPAAPVSIRAYPDGPFLIRGGFVLETGETEEVVDRSVTALCRCGRSRITPLCDGSHTVRRRRPA